MRLVMQLLPLTIVLALYAAYFKLAARMLRISRVGWGAAFLFSGLIFALTAAGSLASAYLGTQPPGAIGVLFGFAIHLFLGAWFFGQRALASDGGSLGWTGGAKLTGLAVLLLVITGAVLFGISRALLSAAAP